MLNYSNIADEVGKDVGTIKRWVSILEVSGIIYILEPFCSDTNPGVKAGDSLNVKVSEVVSMLGSYIISYEVVK